MAERSVFVSSTSEDLSGFREQARDAALRAGFLPRMMEYFAASGAAPLDECVRQIENAYQEGPVDVLVVIVGHRYGWIPSGQPNGERKSITWIECERAKAAGIEILAFLVDEKERWPAEGYEEYRLFQAARNGDAPESFAALAAEVAEARKCLARLKAWLKQLGVKATFRTKEDIGRDVLNALHQWRFRNSASRPGVPSSVNPADEVRYLRNLLDTASEIDIRGLRVVTADVRRYGMKDLYVPLRLTDTARYVTAEAESITQLRETDSWKPSRESLREALQNRLLTIVGDPGAGKTTTLKRIACLLCESLSPDGTAADTGSEELGLADGAFPMLIRLGKLAEHISTSMGRPDTPTTRTSADWLSHFLSAMSAEQGIELPARFFAKKMRDGQAVLLLDGLDEAPSQAVQQQLSELIGAAANAYKESHFVVTTRPGAYRGDSVIPGFAIARIEPLDDEAIEKFLMLWYRSLFHDAPPARARHAQRQLLETLRTRKDLYRMAGNPVMLTALAVVHWTDDHHLPDQRAELFESVIAWLSRSRNRRDQTAPKRAMELLQELALRMQCEPGGRKLQILRRSGAQLIEGEFREVAPELRLSRAETFLEDEEAISGILVGRGHDICFWHPTFQEYLAARAIATRTEAEQAGLLLTRQNADTGARIFQGEWSETVLLTAGILALNGRRRVDALLTRIFDQIAGELVLEDQARFVALLGAISADLASLEYTPDFERFRPVLDQAAQVLSSKSAPPVPIDVVIQVAEVLGFAGASNTRQPAGNQWVAFPAGVFLMGSQASDPQAAHFDPEAITIESPVHEVHLPAFAIASHPVTVAEFQEFVANRGYDAPSFWTEGGFHLRREPERWTEQLRHPTRPVVGVTWYEAAAYCRWAGYRLPSEAEWERAARGTEGRRYPWGSEQAPRANLMNYGIVNVGHTTPVGVYALGATPEGLMDMAGNVWEWCQDWFSTTHYRSKAQSSAAGPEAGTARVMRGGAWDSVEFHCRSSYRDCFQPHLRANVLGFRLAKSL